GGRKFRFNYSDATGFDITAVFILKPHRHNQNPLGTFQNVLTVVYLNEKRCKGTFQNVLTVVYLNEKRCKPATQKININL
ncbi:hypothetical protein, partial [Okeania hirsuta]|uniref:hypothetical protein n=1 Tax=Okeania hirsuta TaxID=1458930 RepID=UPI000FA1E9D7